MSATTFLPGTIQRMKAARLLPVLLSLSFLFILTSHVCSQELSFKRYGPKEGLPGTVIYQCVQDKKGFIWFATNRGVSRFDGKDFRTFSKADGLPDNEIIKIHADKYNNIWFISFLGVPSVLHNDTIRQINCKGIFFIVEDVLNDSIVLLSNQMPNMQNAGYLLGCYSSVNRPGNWNFSPTCVDVLPDSFQYPAVLRASSPLGTRFYYADVNKQKSSIIIKKGKVEKRLLFTKGPFFTSFNTHSFIEVSADKRGITFTTPDSLYYADLNGIYPLISLQKLGLNTVSYSDVSSMFCENDSTLWLCTKNKGLIRISNFMKESRSFQYFFSGRYCSSILKDKEGGYWITTLDDGVYYVPNLIFFKFYNGETKTIGNALCIKSFDSQRLAAGFADGTILTVHTDDLKSHIFSRWSSQSKNNRVLDIAAYPGNNLVIASDAGLYMLSPEGNYQKLHHVPGMKGVLVRDDSTIVAATAARLIILGKNRRKWASLYDTRVTCVAILGKNYFWGTLNGAYGLIKDSLVSFGNKHPNLNRIINHIDIAPDSALWISTQEGIVVLKKETLHIINKRQGLLSDLCKHVLFDGKTAWISTDQGISRVDYRWEKNAFSFHISNIIEGDGLISNEVNQTALAGDYIWAATEQGISFFPKTYTGSLYTLPTVSITRIIAGNIKQPLSDTIQLDYKKNNFLVEVFCPSYRSCRNIFYEYRVPELDTNWHVTTDNYIGFTSLPFGQFVLEIRALNKWGQRTIAPKKITIINDPPFWKSTWFSVLIYIISIFSVAVLFYFINRVRQRKNDQAYRMNQKLRDLEIMALRAQMNPHFIFNCLSSIQHYILEADVVNANLYLHKFSALIRKMFQYSKDSAISLADEIESIKLYLELEKMRLQERMNFKIVAEDPGLYSLYIPPMIIQPYIENAVNHGVSPLQNRKGMITVSFNRSDDHIDCFIEDNGVGINASRKNHHPVKEGHTSMGNSITVNRIHAINSLQKNKIILEIIDKTELNPEDSGTIVHLSFPVINE